MKKYIYPAKFIKQKNGFTVDFIDFNCTTEGNSLIEAIEMAKEAMALYLEDLNIKDIPDPTLNFNKIKLNTDEFISLIELDIDEYRLKYDNKAVKKTLTIPNWLNKKAELQNINFSQVLQTALKKELHIDI